MKLISDVCTNALCEQIAHEKYNSNLYMYMCGYLRNKGLDNIAKIFEHQHQEEFEHSIMFFDLLTDLNADVIIPEIEEMSMPFNSILEIANMYLEREVLTTNSINAIKKMAIAEDNPVVEEMLRKMIRLQRVEYAEATSFLDKALLFPEWWQVGLWDASLAK